MEAAGLYIALLSRCWRRGSVTADANALRSLYGRRCTAWEESLAMVLPCFQERDGRLFNKRLEDERAIADQHSAKASSSAKARWARWKAHRDANAMRTHSDRNANAMQGQDRTEQDKTLQDSKGRASRAAPEEEDWLSVFAEFPSLNNGEAHAAFREWLDYRKASRFRKWSLPTVRKSLRMFEGHGSHLLARQIDESIRNGWQGLFPPKRASGAPSALQGKPGGMREWFAQQDAKSAERIVDVKGGVSP